MRTSVSVSKHLRSVWFFFYSLFFPHGIFDLDECVPNCHIVRGDADIQSTHLRRVDPNPVLSCRDELGDAEDDDATGDGLG